jgi:hypothetical protein
VLGVKAKPLRGRLATTGAENVLQAHGHGEASLDPSARRWLFAAVNFGDKSGLWPLLSPKFTVAKKPLPRGGVKPRLAIAHD